MNIFVHRASEYLTDHEAHGDGLICFSLLNGLAERGHQIFAYANAASIRQGSPNLHVQTARHRVPANSLAQWEHSWRADRWRREVEQAAPIDLVWRMHPYGAGCPYPPQTGGKPLVVGPLFYNWPSDTPMTGTAGRPRLGIGIAGLVTPIAERGWDRTLRQAALILCATEPHAQAMAAQYPQARTVALPVIVAPPVSGQPVRRPDPAKPARLIFVANLVPSKNPLVFCETVQLLRERGIHAEGIVLGDGPERPALEAYCAAQGLGSAVCFRGKVPNSDVYGFLAEADFLVSASRGEPYGRSIAEAMSVGTPCLCHRSGGPADFIENGQDGLLADELTASAYADRLVPVLSDPAAWAALSAGRIAKSRRLAQRSGAVPIGKSVAGNRAERQETNTSMMTKLSQVSAGRENNFDFLRFFLATCVIFSHAFNLLYDGDRWHEYDPLTYLTNGQFAFGGGAVEGFFLISGFLITQSWMRSKSGLDYAKKRVLRIVPALVVVLLVTTFVFGPIATNLKMASYFQNPHTYAYLGFLGAKSLHQTDRLPGVFAHNPTLFQVNGSLWTVRCEALCYLMVAVLGLLGLYRFRFLILLASVATLPVMVHLTSRAGGNGDWAGAFHVLVFFLWGMTFYFYRDVIPFSRAILGVALALLVAADLRNDLQWTMPWAGGYVLFYAAFSPRLKMQHFARHGDFSYGLYLYAFPIQQILVEYFAKSFNAYTLALATFALTLGMAVLSWNLVEKRFLRLKRPSAVPDAPSPIVSGEASADAELIGRPG